MTDRPTMRTALTIFLIILISGAGFSSVCADPGDYLSAGEAGTIAAGSTALFLTGLSIASFDSTHAAHWNQPLPGERRLQRLLGGRYYPDKSNLFARRLGGAIVPAIALAAIAATDLAYPALDRDRDFGQDMLLFTSGLLAVQGVTGIAKGLVKRSRPMITLEPELAARRTGSRYDFDRKSFFSGHTSTAFFAMTYANKRVRSAMYREMDRDHYRHWRWLPPIIAYGSATAVGWSRIAAYDHYVSDVAVGALVGWLAAELFYAFGDQTYRDLTNSENTPLFISIRVPL